MTLPLWWTRELTLHDRGEDVRAVQELVGLPQTGEYNIATALTVRGAQALAGLPITGVVDSATAMALGPRSRDSVLPEWYSAPLFPGQPGYDVVTAALGGESGVRRLQGNYGMVPTGIIDEQTALIMSARGVDHG